MSCTDSWGWFILLRSLGFKVRTTQRHCGRLHTVGMGVRCLTALLETHRDIYHDVLFGNNRLVIDGCDLIKQLYFDSGRTQLRPPSSRSAWKNMQTTKIVLSTGPDSSETESRRSSVVLSTAPWLPRYVTQWVEVRTRRKFWPQGEMSGKWSRLVLHSSKALCWVTPRTS